MQDFIEFISENAFLTDEHKSILIAQVIDPNDQKKVIEIINNYGKGQEYIKNILKNIEFDKQKELFEFTKDYLIEQEKLDSIKTLDSFINI